MWDISRWGRRPRRRAKRRGRRASGILVWSVCLSSIAGRHTLGVVQTHLAERMGEKGKKSRQLSNVFVKLNSDWVLYFAIHRPVLTSGEFHSSILCTFFDQPAATFHCASADRTLSAAKPLKVSWKAATALTFDATLPRVPWGGGGWGAPSQQIYGSVTLLSSPVVLAKCHHQMFWAAATQATK